MPSFLARGSLNKRQLGCKHENYACRFLKRQGLKALSSNYSCRHGEIDLIMLDSNNNTLVFIEVRFRKSDTYGSALDTVDAAKQGRIRSSAASFLQRHSAYRNHSCRFDVVAISPNPDKKEPLVNWVINAFY